MDRLRQLLRDHPELFTRQPLLKRMLSGLTEEEANGVATILEIRIRRAGAGAALAERTRQ